MISPFTNRFAYPRDLLLLFVGGSVIPLTCSYNWQAPYNLSFGQCPISAHSSL